MSESTQYGEVLKKYYRFHSLFYDITRWSFLFGRKEIITNYLPEKFKPEKILEVGCGTGKNMAILHKKYPSAHITGVDISSSMLKIARKKFSQRSENISLNEVYYDSKAFPKQQFDLILFSYSLSMMNPGWDTAIENAHYHLKENGFIAVVDFFESGWPAFKKWMGVNHVRMDSHLLPGLRKHFEPTQEVTKRAYLGIWKYLLYIGRKK